MIEGFPTTAQLAHLVLYQPDYIRGACTTAFLEEHLQELVDLDRRADQEEDR